MLAVCLWMSGCDADTQSVANQIRFTLAPCLGMVDEALNAKRACSRSGIESLVDPAEPNACLVIQQWSKDAIGMRAQFKDRRLQGLSSSMLQLDTNLETQASLYFFKTPVTQTFCETLQVDDSCEGPCVLRLSDLVTADTSRQTIRIDFQIVSNSRLVCTYAWNDEWRAAEHCDGIDNDCDGIVDESAVDAFDEICDGLDNDCDGQIDEALIGRSDEVCDAIDNDCDGLVDEMPSDARDEVCDQKDNDCDGQIDEGFGAASEVCDATDNDCDGVVDEGFEELMERCDEQDNDCDGVVDEAAGCCGQDRDCDVDTPACREGVCQACHPQLDVNGNLCPPSRPICERTSDGVRCVPCERDVECDGNDFCVDGHCVVCQPDSGTGCPAAQPWCEVLDGRPSCGPCTLDHQCGGDAVCHGGQCVRCAPGQPDSCPHDTPVCIPSEAGFQCVPCGADAPCEDDQLCHEASGLCVPCLPNQTEYCPSEAPFCHPSVNPRRLFECSSRCISDEECAGQTPLSPLCVGGVCAVCNPDEEHAGCLTTEQPVCLAIEGEGLACQSCTGNDQCRQLRDDQRSICIKNGARAGQCAECDGAEDCGGAQYCVAHRCSVCNPDGHGGCGGAKPRCAPRADGAGYECTPCSVNGRGDENGCPSNRVCVQQPDQPPTCQECDPASGQGCIEYGLVCRDLGQSAVCAECDVTSDDCQVGPYTSSICRRFAMVMRCLDCDPTAVTGQENGCLEDASFCLEDGRCAECDPVGRMGCDGEKPICKINAQGISACQPCTASLECQLLDRATDAYCDIDSGRCEACPVGVIDPPIGCPQVQQCVEEDCQAMNDARPFCVPSIEGCSACDPLALELDRYTCDGRTPICNQSGTCVPCTSNQQCKDRPGSGGAYCDVATGRCGVCNPVDDRGCNSLSLTRCVAPDGEAPRCVQCVEDADCNGEFCQVEQGLCGCRDNADCQRLLDRPLCVGPVGARACQPCRIEDCQEPECASAVACQSCVAVDRANGGNVEVPDQREDIGQNQVIIDPSDYGCDENSDTPICVAGRCKRCTEDEECERRPGVCQPM